ncbi:bifunctional 4-hydroxy-2-oxoglutarate aldolase/2-dehydro-3-deoxy-phosphogluconate aldolase [Micromonospora sp. NPDC005806]|uniref:bifunctional 4-hydroxy-2-oxoglutarate aldolase/2-dehydro-3-deoxy-phosphogluconate aldolase n=1 Tax=Micromonospora sp. NPDC005806 TaxID=3364234 RepID=UPI0036C405A8
MSGVLELLRRQRVLPVLRLPSAAQATAGATAMFGYGLRVVELTATTPDWAAALRDTRRAAPRGTLVGLGTVTSGALAIQAVEAGAQFLVSPWPAPDVRAVAQNAGLPFLEGAFTPGEVAAAAAHGPVKVFPAHVGGPSFLVSLRQLLPEADLVPTGGIALEAVPDWLRAGACAVGVGSDLLRPGAADRLRSLLAAFDEPTEEAR